MRKDHADILHHAYELAELAKKETNETARLQLLESISGSIERVLREDGGAAAFQRLAQSNRILAKETK